jgi:hypothetical protein
MFAEEDRVKRQGCFTAREKGKMKLSMAMTASTILDYSFQESSTWEADKPFETKYQQTSPHGGKLVFAILTRFINLRA